MFLSTAYHTYYIEIFAPGPFCYLPDTRERDRQRDRERGASMGVLSGMGVMGELQPLKHTVKDGIVVHRMDGGVFCFQTSIYDFAPMPPPERFEMISRLSGPPGLLSKYLQRRCPLHHQSNGVKILCCPSVPRLETFVGYKCGSRAAFSTAVSCSVYSLRRPPFALGRVLPARQVL